MNILPKAYSNERRAVNLQEELQTLEELIDQL